VPTQKRKDIYLGMNEQGFRKIGLGCREEDKSC
jgi:hypothetical protein